MLKISVENKEFNSFQDAEQFVRRELNNSGQNGIQVSVKVEISEGIDFITDIFFSDNDSLRDVITNDLADKIYTIMNNMNGDYVAASFPDSFSRYTLEDFDNPSDKAHFIVAQTLSILYVRLTEDYIN